MQAGGCRSSGISAGKAVPARRTSPDASAAFPKVVSVRDGSRPEDRSTQSMQIKDDLQRTIDIQHRLRNQHTLNPTSWNYNITNDFSPSWAQPAWRRAFGRRFRGAPRLLTAELTCRGSAGPGSCAKTPANSSTASSWTTISCAMLS